MGKAVALSNDKFKCLIFMHFLGVTEEKQTELESRQNAKFKCLIFMHFLGVTEEKRTELESRQNAYCRDLNRHHLYAR